MYIQKHRFHQQFLSFNDRHISHLQSLSFNERHVFLSGGTGEEVGIWQGGGSTAARRRGLAREPVKGTRRVQLVRRGGRDVSTLYGREGRGGGGASRGRHRVVQPSQHLARLHRQRTRAVVARASRRGALPAGVKRLQALERRAPRRRDARERGLPTHEREGRGAPVRGNGPRAERACVVSD